MKTVLTHGVFDILHAGHLAYFKSAKKFGDRLVVSITTDRFVNKGPGRPYFTTALRAEMVKALGVVDDVVISDSPTAVEIINQVKPDFYVKGPDYQDLTRDPTGEIYNEKKAVEAHDGKLVFTTEETFSSSTIINKFFQGWSEAQKIQIEKVNQCGGIDSVRKAIDEIKKVSVLVVGEPIIDIYRFCMPEGISSKSPTISARFEREEVYRGGSEAIYNHLNSFCRNESLLGHHCLRAIDAKLPTKIRYVSTDKAQRVFEVTHINEHVWNLDVATEQLISQSKDFDVVVAADFGHGLFEGSVLEAMRHVKPFVGLNVQTNSSNFGFNIHTKHLRWDYLCLDTREARLAEHDRFSPPLAVAHKTYCAEPNERPLAITLGSGGSCLYSEKKEYLSPAFSDVVVDATGAGDAFFAITTCLLATGCKPALVPFIGNVFAGLKTKIVGNKAAVTKAQLLKACEGILK